MKYLIILFVLCFGSTGVTSKQVTLVDSNEVISVEPIVLSRFLDSELLNKIYSTHENVMKYLESGNAAFLTSIKNCLTKEFPKDTVIRSRITTDGSFKDVEIMCDKLLDSYLGENYGTQFHDMRLQLALSTSEIKSDDVAYFLINGFFDNLKKLATINVKHPTNYIDFTYRLDPLSHMEQQELKNRLSEIRREICSSFILTYLEPSFASTNACDFLMQKQKDRDFKKKYFRQLARLTSYFDLKFKEFQTKQFQEYVNSVRSNRFLLLLGEKPSNEQILTQIDVLIEKSKKRVRKYDNLTPTEFYNTQWAYTYTEIIVKKELALTETEITQMDMTVQNILKSEGRWNLAQGIGTMAGSIAVGLSCFLPQTRYIGIINRGLCARIAFASIDVYFLIDGHMAFVSAQDDYLSTIIDTMDINESNIDDMTSTKNMNILSLALLPFFF